jgi:hypothetical protein
VAELKSNRDLYLAIDALSKTHSGCARPLEHYLLSLLDSSQRYSERNDITLAEFYDLVSSSYTRDIPAFNPDWRDQYDKLPHERNDYAGFRATLIRQIVDLREMDENGTLRNEQRYFGASAPRHAYWYNVDPIAYLECAMAGSFGGWESGDETGRQNVPGPVVVFGNDGSIQTANPEDLHQPTVQMPSVTWEQFQAFIICGQSYE